MRFNHCFADAFNFLIFRNIGTYLSKVAPFNSAPCESVWHHSRPVQFGFPPGVHIVILLQALAFAQAWIRFRRAVLIDSESKQAVWARPCPSAALQDDSVSVFPNRPMGGSDRTSTKTVSSVEDSALHADQPWRAWISRMAACIVDRRMWQNLSCLISHARSAGVPGSRSTHFEFIPEWLYPNPLILSLIMQIVLNSSVSRGSQSVHE